MPWTSIAPTTTPPAWNVTDLELLKRVQYFLMENGAADADGITFITSQFTVTEVVNVLNQRQEKFLRDTAAITTRASQASTPNIPRYALPQDWIMTRRLTWQAQGGKITSLPRTDAYALDHGMLDWQQNFDLPSVYNDGSDLPTLTVEIAKAPSQAGNMTLHYVAQPAQLTGLGVSLNIPDEMESAVLFGAMADLLSSEGEASDPERAAYCEFRYNLCVEAARGMMEGYE